MGGVTQKNSHMTCLYSTIFSKECRRYIWLMASAVTMQSTWIFYIYLFIIDAFIQLTFSHHTFKMNDVGVIKLSHDAGLAEEVPSLFIGVTSFQGLDSYINFSFTRNLQSPAANLSKLSCKQWKWLLFMISGLDSFTYNALRESGINSAYCLQALLLTYSNDFFNLYTRSINLLCKFSYCLVRVFVCKWINICLYPCN